jgi:hypothetical protein
MPMTEREMRLAQEALAKRPITPAEPVPESMLKAPGRKKSTGVRDALHSKMKAANEAYQNGSKCLRTRDVELWFGLKPGSLKQWRSIRLRNGKDGVIGAYMPRKKKEERA